jgi:two-component system response regulator AtoC
MSVTNSPLASAEILIVEDELMLRKRLVARLESEGAEVTVAGNVEEARNCLASMDFDFAMVDVHLPDGLGIDLLKDHSFDAETAVIVMTAEGGVEVAVEAMRLGAADYLSKPFDMGELPLILGACKKARQADRIEQHRKRSEKDSRSFFFGKGLSHLEGQLEKIFDADSRLKDRLPPVLLEGETGTGKSTLAKMIHEGGPRAKEPFVELNCSALPENLAESELFGHERGAFTDAKTSRMGLFEAASGGTLFLDEIPSLSLSIQAKILTALESGIIRRVGGNKEIKIDARLLTATNLDLQQAIQEGIFRQDLYHRLDLLRIQIPPLRARLEDVPLMAEFLLNGIRKRYRLKNLEISEKGREQLMKYNWPGNVRELAHELERAVVLADGDSLEFPNLSSNGISNSVPLSNSSEPANDWLNESWVFPEDGGFQMEDAIVRLIQKALDQADGNVSGASRLLGVPRDFIRYRLKKQGI